MCGYVPGLTGPSTSADEAGPVWPIELFSQAPAERVLHEQQLGGEVLLAIDTALGSSVALGYSDQIFEVSSDDTRGHAEVVGDLLLRVFELSGAQPAEVTRVVSGIGPGPFTGLRIGMSAARAFAAAREVPVLAVQSHEAVAQAVLQQHAATAFRVVQDAKRRELFVTEFAGINLNGQPVRAVDARLEQRATFEQQVTDVWPVRIPAARLVQLAVRRLGLGQAFEDDQALYLRAPDVKPTAAVKRVST